MNIVIRATQLVFLIFGVAISCWAPMIPFVKARLDLNEAELGLALLVFGIGAIVTMPITGWLISRVGSRLLILISGLLILTFIPFLGLASSFFSLSAALFFFGASTSTMNISINAQAILVESQTNRVLMSGFHCLFSVGGLLGVTLVGVLLELKYDLFYCGMLVSTIIAVTILSQYKNLLKNTCKPDYAERAPFVLPEGRVFILGLLCFIAFVAEGSMLDWSAEFLRTSLNYPASQAGIGYAVFSIAMALGRFFGDKWIARFNAHTVFQVGGLLTAIGFTTLISAPFQYVELLGFFMIGLGAANIVPILFSASGKSSSSSASLTIVASFGYAGLLIGPGIIGLVANSLSLRIALAGIAGLLVLSATFGSVRLKARAPLEA